MASFGLTYSLADLNFAQTKSIGIFNIAVNLWPFLSQRPEIGALTLLTNPTLDLHPSPGDRIKVESYPIAVRGKAGRIFWDQFGVYQAAKRAGHPWLLLPKGFASFAARPPVKLATWVADANHEFYRQRYPRAVPPLEAWYFEKSFAASLRRSSVIFTISEFTRAEVLRIAQSRGWKLPGVFNAGIGFVRPPESAVEKTNTIVVLTSPWPHKRGDLALEYLARWQRETGFEGSVVWVGRLPSALTLPDIPGWRHHTRLPEEEFKPLVRQSGALVYFSEYEGFGMPPVESILMGTCPVYSDLPATREVMRGAGCPFANESYPAFAGAVKRALEIGGKALEVWRDELLQRHQWPEVAARMVAGMLGAN